MSAERRLAEAFVRRHPRQAAEQLALAAPGEGARILSAYEDEVAAQTLQHVDAGQATKILAALPAERRAKLIAALPARRAGLFLQGAGPETREAWLESLPGELARALRTYLAYPADTAAAVMDPSVLAAPAEMTAAHALQLVTRHASRALYYLYVVDAEHRPVGVLNLRELMGASARAPLSTLMHSPVVSIPARAAMTVVAAHPGWRNWHALPVVDGEGVLVGVVRYETGERIRGRDDEDRAGGDVGVALTEAIWTLTAHVVDEVAGAVRRKDENHD